MQVLYIVTFPIKSMYFRSEWKIVSTDLIERVRAALGYDESRLPEILAVAAAGRFQDPSIIPSDNPVRTSVSRDMNPVYLVRLEYLHPSQLNKTQGFYYPDS